MECINNATRLRREVLIRIARYFSEGNLIGLADRLPNIMRPKGQESVRCCIYKDRAVLRSRCIAAMGFRLEDEDDDSIPLSYYADLALGRGKAGGPVMTVLDIACRGCLPSRYFVTNACQGCLARPCESTCPRDAIHVHNGASTIDQSKCINCGKCQKVCPYSAIVRLPVPCEDACPVSAIHKNTEGVAEIDFDKCISCGRCMRACPFGAVMERSQLIDVLRVLKSDRQAIALVAPAILGQFPGGLEEMATALRQLGFTQMIEVARGADITARKEAHEFVERMQRGDRFMTTSCCPAYMEAVRKRLPELRPFVSDTATPMHYAAELARKEYPDAATVFIGPCVAKRREGQLDPAVDYVLTFEELGAMLVANDIDVAVCDGTPCANPASAEGRGFPITGGVAAAVKAVVDANSAEGNAIEAKPIMVNGLEPKAVALLAAFAKNSCPGNLVEVMACEGGCVAGAGVVGMPRHSCQAVKNLMQQSRKIEKE